MEFPRIIISQDDDSEDPREAVLNAMIKEWLILTELGISGDSNHILT